MILKFNRLHTATLFLFLGLLVQPVELKAQFGNHSEEIQAGSEREILLSSGVVGSTGSSLPFWFHANRSGRLNANESSQWLMELEYRETYLERSGFKVGGGFLATGRVAQSNPNSSFFFPEAHLELSYGNIRFRGGRYRDYIGLNNPELSIGSMMVSHHATPIPRLTLDSKGFMQIPWLNGVAEASFSLSHGWFEKERYVKNPFLHQKFLYLKINVGRFSGVGGIVHNSQWSGVEPDRGQLPGSFQDYLRVFFARSADPNSNANPGEVINVIGNSIAAYDFGLFYRGEGFRASVARMFYLEDKVSTRFRSPWDGVWGVNVERDDKASVFSSFTYEHINTKNQDAKSWELIGRRNYYSNYMYQSGWTYHDKVIGLPLILFDGEGITNNVVVGHHFGISGEFLYNFSFKAKLTYSRNYGIQDDWVEQPGESIPKDREDVTPYGEFRKDQYSWGIDLNYQPDFNTHVIWNMSAAGDFGNLYENSFGLMVGVTVRL